MLSFHLLILTYFVINGFILVWAINQGHISKTWEAIMIIYLGIVWLIMWTIVQLFNWVMNLF